MNNLEQILNRLPASIQGRIHTLPADLLEKLEEIRIKAYCDIRILAQNREFILTGEPITENDLNEILNRLLDYSYYAYEEELAKGYITIEGGHRVGVCGRAVVENGRVTLLKDVSSLNLRRSREIKGAGDKVIPHMISTDGAPPENLLIVSPPKCGKTTLIRDLTRLLSQRGYKVGLCDERSEIAGMYHGIPSFDLGTRTDILDGCPKAEGMIMLIRAMSPDVVVTDEIGKKEDVEAVEAAVCAGVCILTTIHGNSYEDVMRSNIRSLVEKGIFSRIVFLSNRPSTGAVREVLHV